MSNVVTAVVAAFVGAGAAAGVMFSGIIEQPHDAAPKVAERPAEDDAFDMPSIDYSGQIDDLKFEIRTLRANQNTIEKPVASGIDPAEIEAMKVTIKGLEAKLKGGVVAPKVDTNDAGEIIVEGGLDGAVRGIYANMEAERKEERRLDRHQKRMDRLEESKTKVAEFIPKFLAKQAKRWKMDDIQVEQASSVMVSHAQMRLDLFSEHESQKIDDIEVDSAVFKQSIKDLDAVTISSLSSIVDEKTAKLLLNSSNRVGRGDDGSNAKSKTVRKKEVGKKDRGGRKSR